MPKIIPPNALRALRGARQVSDRPRSVKSTCSFFARPHIGRSAGLTGAQSPTSSRRAGWNIRLARRTGTGRKTRC